MSNKTLGSRWDIYKHLGDDTIHWVSITTSFTIVFFLTLFTAFILRRTIHIDIAKYDKVNTYLPLF